MCSSCDTGLIPLETQIHSCFSKYPLWKPPHPPHPALIHLLFLLPARLSAPLPYRLHLLSEWICIVSTEIFFHLMNFARKLAEADSGFHTCGRNGSSGIKKKADYKLLASSSTFTSHGKCHSLRDGYNCFSTDWINDPWLHNAHNLFLSLFFSLHRVKRVNLCVYSPQ